MVITRCISQEVAQMLLHHREATGHKPQAKEIKRVERSLVEEVSLRVERAEIFGFLGPNGSRQNHDD